MPPFVYQQLQNTAAGRAILAIASGAADKVPVLTAAGTAELRDFFASGTAWTPAVTFATVGDLSIAYTHQVGRYMRLGTLIVVWFSIQTSTFTHTTASGALQITGLPVAPASVSGMLWPGFVGGWGGITKANYTNMSLSNDSGATFLTVLTSGSAQNVATLAAADTPSAGTLTLRGFFAYTAA